MDRRADLMDDPDIKLLRRAYRAFETRDLGELERIADPEIQVSTVTGVLAGRSEPYRGRREIEQYLGDLAETWDEIELTPQRFYRLAGERLLVFGRVRARRGNRLVDAPNAWLWSLGDGQICSVNVFGDLQEAWSLLEQEAGRAASDLSA